MKNSIQGIDHVMVTVGDLGVAKEFYEENLELKEIECLLDHVSASYEYGLLDQIASSVFPIVLKCYSYLTEMNKVSINWKNEYTQLLNLLIKLQFCTERVSIKRLEIFYSNLIKKRQGCNALLQVCVSDNP